MDDRFVDNGEPVKTPEELKRIFEKLDKAEQSAFADRYVSLAEAVLSQAVRDYKNLYIKKLRGRRLDPREEVELASLENYFRYGNLYVETMMTGEELLVYLRKQAEEEAGITHKKRR